MWTPGTWRLFFKSEKGIFLTFFSLFLHANTNFLNSDSGFTYFSYDNNLHFCKDDNLHFSEENNNHHHHGEQPFTLVVHSILWWASVPQTRHISSNLVSKHTVEKSQTNAIWIEIYLVKKHIWPYLLSTNTPNVQIFTQNTTTKTYMFVCLCLSLKRTNSHSVQFEDILFQKVKLLKENPILLVPE